MPTWPFFLSPRPLSTLILPSAASGRVCESLRYRRVATLHAAPRRAHFTRLCRSRQFGRGTKYLHANSIFAFFPATATSPAFLGFLTLQGRRLQCGFARLQAAAWMSTSPAAVCVYGARYTESYRCLSTASTVFFAVLAGCIMSFSCGPAQPLDGTNAGRARTERYTCVPPARRPRPTLTVATASCALTRPPHHPRLKTA